VKLLTLARDLRRRKAREKHSLFVAEGVRSVEELLRSGLVVRGALIAPQLGEAPRGVNLREMLDSAGVEISEVSEQEFRSAAETDSPQGVLAIATIPQRSLDTLEVGPVCRVVLLDRIQDPGNAGTIIRTAAALGATATIALPGTVDLWNPKVIRSSMGAHFRHPALHAALEDTFAFLEARQIDLWATDLRGEEFTPAGAPPRLAIAFGNEGSGVTTALRSKSTKSVALRIAPNVESLNVAVATGIILHELRA
jgi:TrmH family RNA methyltransferase